jgi:hypothetical protein
MSHADVLTNFAYIVNKPPAQSCPAGPHLTAWNP